MITSGVGPGLLLITLLACLAVFFLLSHETLLYGWIKVKVFDRYVRVEKDASRYVSGTGLGLAIVKQIVDLHQGRV
ncbi:MAG: hypothetical protein H0V70_10370 [Ktedonobacteraceae bacterium]|nr:hypothetical protein [Ktedonobacteraceae bacterium]